MSKTPTTYERWHFADARQLFEAARDASADAERIRAQLLAMEARAHSIGGGGFEPRVFSSGDPDKMGRRIAAYVDREAALEKRQAEDYELIDLACAVLYGTDNETGLAALVPPWWCDAIWWRYLDGATWEETGAAVGYSAHRCWEVTQTAFEIIDGWGIIAVMQGRGGAEE